MKPSLEAVRAWDRDDLLAGFKARFDLPAGVIYLDGNSLGPPPRTAGERIATVIAQEWGDGLIRSWNDADWIGAPRRVGGKIGRLIGAQANEVIVADSTSVNLFKLLAAVLAARPGRNVILTETGNFPTDLYIAGGAAGTIPGASVRAVVPGEVEAAIDRDTAVVLLTHVHYKTAARRDMAALTAAAHAAGALMLWDLSHSAGAVRVDLTGCEADLAVGCGYKFLNGGPGAPAFLFIAGRLQAEMRSPLTGWMGHAAPFDFVDDYEPAPGVGRFLCGTPPILGLAALEAGIDLALEVDSAALEAKSASLWRLFADLMAERLGPAFRLITPADPRARGSHISFAHPDGFAIMRVLIAWGVIGDFREPDVMRFGITPLYLGYEDIWRAVETLAEVMESGEWREMPPRARGQVT
ncbi:MAG TPA: kynureninase [Caulobacteraceae bacterium]|jgi:kynureninase|nr:kynureninase [Caulobacteraceae bacterium]